MAVAAKPVDTVGKMPARLDDFEVGDTVKLTVPRQGRKAELPVTLPPGT